MTRSVWLRTTAALISIGLSCLALAACTQPGVSEPCLPPSFSLTPATAKPGASITVAADDSTCNPRYGENAQIQVEVYDGSGAKVLETLAPMNDAGGFGVNLELPTDAVPGEGMVAAYPFNLDWCDDTGRNNRVGAIGEQEITLVSCAMPSMPLRIEP